MLTVDTCYDSKRLRSHLERRFLQCCYRIEELMQEPARILVERNNLQRLFRQWCLRRQADDRSICLDHCPIDHPLGIARINLYLDGGIVLRFPQLLQEKVVAVARTSCRTQLTVLSLIARPGRVCIFYCFADRLFHVLPDFF